MLGMLVGISWERLSVNSIGDFILVNLTTTIAAGFPPVVSVLIGHRGWTKSISHRPRIPGMMVPL